jgi:hypothetical protein
LPAFEIDLEVFGAQALSVGDNIELLLCQLDRRRVLFEPIAQLRVAKRSQCVSRPVLKGYIGLFVGVT